MAGMMLVSSARDLVLLFVGLELLSIPTYVLLYLGRNIGRLARIDGQVLLSQHSLVGRDAVRIQLPVRCRRARPSCTQLHAVAGGPRTGFRHAAGWRAGAGAGFRRPGLQSHGRAVPLLRSRRVSRHDSRQRRVVVRVAQARRPGRAGAHVVAAMPGFEPLRLAHCLGAGAADHDARQCRGPVARQHSPAAGLLRRSPTAATC